MSNNHHIRNVHPTGSRNARFTLGYMTPTNLDQYLASMFLGVADTAQKHDINLLCFVCGMLHTPIAFGAQANILFDLAGPENIDGLVFNSTSLGFHVSPAEMNACIARYSPIPATSIGLVESVPSIAIECESGMRELVSHLIEVHNYRRIAIIRGIKGHPEDDARYRAYTETLAQHHIPLDPRLVTPHYTWNDDWQKASIEAINVLLDERKLRPKLDVEAIIGNNDASAISAMEVLRERGIQVPDDLAVVGFDNRDLCQVVTPPVTTVRQPMDACTRWAVETVLSQLQGRQVPEQVMLPTMMVVRQSCGCADPMVAQAAAGLIQGNQETFEGFLTAHRDDIVTAMIQAVGGMSETGPAIGWSTQLLDGFALEIQGSSSGIFLRELNNVFRQIRASGGDIGVWQNALSALRRCVLPALAGQALSQAEDLWQQARVAIGRITEQVRTFQALQGERQAQILRELSQGLITIFNIKDLMDALAEGLPRLGIPSCYLALYEDPTSPLDWSRLRMAYTEQGRIALEPEGRRFPSSQLVPEGLWPQGRRYTYVVEPLYFHKEQIGVVLFEVGPHDGAVYDVLRGEISNALQGALLVEQVQTHAHKLTSAYQEIQTLNRQLQEENMRMVAELNVARRLQEMILPPPEELQQISGLDIAGYMQPADEVGGDYYDVLSSNGVVHLGIGDVTGHGLESGVLMMMTQTAIRTLIEHGETDPVKFVTTLNRLIYKNARRMQTDRTLTFALIEYQEGQVKVVGQHEELLVVRHGGQVERIDTAELGFPVGLAEDIAEWVSTATTALQRGESIVLYTDGITEAENPQREFYGLERLCEVISRSWDQSAASIQQAVIADVIGFIGEQKVHDDLTLVVMKQQ